MCKRKDKQTLKCVFLVLIMNFSVHAQVYNYEPIKHTNFESNPAYLSSRKTQRMVSYTHHGNTFMSDKFSFDVIKVAAYNPQFFSGFGLVANNTKINDSTGYRYFGVGAAYRIVFFDKVFVRLGALCKYINISAAKGLFDYYTFSPTSDETIKKRNIQNANLSVSFSSPRDKYYLSAGILNLPLFHESSGTQFIFPQYYVLNIGDFGKIIGDRVEEISFTGIAKHMYGQNHLVVSYYANVSVTGFFISRNSSVLCGLRGGYADGKYIHCSPSITYVNRIKRKFLLIKLLYDCAIPAKQNNKTFKPTFQLNLTYTL